MGTRLLGQGLDGEHEGRGSPDGGDAVRPGCRADLVQEPGGRCGRLTWPAGQVSLQEPVSLSTE